MKINNSVIGLWCFRMILALVLASAGMNGYAAEQPNLKFDEPGFFHENVAVVKVDGKWGLIDADGHFVVPATYDDIDGRSLYQGTMIIKNAGKYGLISIAGKEIIPAKYEETDDITPYNKGLFGVQQGGKWGVCDRTGKEIVPTNYDSVHICPDGMIEVTLGKASGLLDKSGSEIIPCTGKYAVIDHGGFSSFDNALSRNFSLVMKDNQWGVVDRNGKELIPAVYDQIIMGDPLFLVRKDKKIGFMNNQGQEIVPLKYDVSGREAAWRSYFREGLAGVAAGGKWGYIDAKDRTVIPFVYDIGTSFENGLAVVQRNHKQGVITKDNTIMIPLQYDSVMIMEDGLFKVQIGDKWGVIDKTNKVVIPMGTDLHMVISGKKTLGFSREGREEFYIKNGDEIIPTPYATVMSFDNGTGLAAAEVNHKWGYTDRKGKLIIPAKYDYAWSFYNGLAPVEVNHKCGYVDKEGKLIIPAAYDMACSFDNGLAAVKINDKWGYIDTKGQFTSWSYQ